MQADAGGKVSPASDEVFDAQGLIARMLVVLRPYYGDLAFTVCVTSEIEPGGGAAINGVCDFTSSPPSIVIRSGLEESALIETLVHELAHLICGYEAGHDQAWIECRDELSVRWAAWHI